MNDIKSSGTIYKILIFAILVNGLAWVGPILGGTPAQPGVGFLVWLTAPLVVALFMRVMGKDWADFGLKPAFKQNARWYVLSVVLFPLILVIVLLVGVFAGAITINAFTLPEFVTALLPMAVIFFISALFEEGGWRGYLAPKVYAINDRLLGHAVVGLIWASWHFPYLRELWVHTSEGLATLLFRFLLGTFVMAIVYGEIRIRTNTFWPAVVMHAVGNTFANTLLAGFAGNGFVTLTRGKEYLGSFGAEGVLTIIAFAILGLYLYRQRSRKEQIVMRSLTVENL